MYRVSSDLLFDMTCLLLFYGQVNLKIWPIHLENSDFFIFHMTRLLLFYGLMNRKIWSMICENSDIFVWHDRSAAILWSCEFKNLAYVPWKQRLFVWHNMSAVILWSCINVKIWSLCCENSDSMFDMIRLLLFSMTMWISRFGQCSVKTATFCLKLPVCCFYSHVNLKIWSIFCENSDFFFEMTHMLLFCVNLKL